MCYLQFIATKFYQQVGNHENHQLQELVSYEPRFPFLGVLEILKVTTNNLELVTLLKGNQ